MSKLTLPSAAIRLREALVEAAWIQWKALGLPASAERPARSVVDPEALILASLWLQRYESRLGKLTRMFATLGSGLVSTQRLKNLRKAYPAGTMADLSVFALAALHGSKDPRWQSLVEGGSSLRRKGMKAEDSFVLFQYPPPALMLRLRLAFSVSIKADTLAFLIALAGLAATVPMVTEAIGYQGRGVRRALEELAAADFIKSVTSVPVSYRAEETRWDQFLELRGSSPGWWHWHQLYAFGADLDHAAGESQDRSSYLQSSQARDLVERHTRLFALFPQLMSDPGKLPGEAYLDRFVEDIGTLADRITHNWA
ncbi:MAG: hypothetical protein ABI836_10180 [Gemmatimonadota bacterium]